MECIRNQRVVLEVLNPMCSFYHKYMLPCRKSFCFPRWYFVIKQQLVDSALNSNYLHRKFWWYHSASLLLTLFGIIFCAETRVDIQLHRLPNSCSPALICSSQKIWMGFWWKETNLKMLTCAGHTACWTSEECEGPPTRSWAPEEFLNF